MILSETSCRPVVGAFTQRARLLRDGWVVDQSLNGSDIPCKPHDACLKLSVLRQSVVSRKADGPTLPNGEVIQTGPENPVPRVVASWTYTSPARSQDLNPLTRRTIQFRTRAYASSTLSASSQDLGNLSPHDRLTYRYLFDLEPAALRPTRSTTSLRQV